MARFSSKQTVFLRALRNPDKPLKEIMTETQVTPKDLTRLSGNDVFVRYVETIRHALALQRTLAVEVQATLTAAQLQQHSGEKISAAKQRVNLELATIYHKPLSPKEKQPTGLDIAHPNSRGS